MLAELNIRNLGIIDSVTIQFDSGFTAITGETGAGKTMIIEAINLLGLSERPVVPRSAFLGQLPGFHDYRATPGRALAQVEACVRELRIAGFKPEQIIEIRRGGA